MASKETTTATARRKYRYGALIAAVTVLLIGATWYWFYGRCGGDRPRQYVGTWKLASAEGKMRELRYRFFEDGVMWTYVGLTRDISIWYVTDDELVIISDADLAPTSITPGQVLETMAQAVTDPCNCRRSIKFAVEWLNGRMVLRPTEIAGQRPTNQDAVTFERVADESAPENGRLSQ
jgi:hypothetical protein